MKISEIVDRTGIAQRRLRYVLEEGLLPGGNAASDGRGTARKFTPFEAFSIACAALLLESGLKRALVRDCLAVLCGPGNRRTRCDADVPLYQAFVTREIARLEVGDWVNIRLCGSGACKQRGLDTGWRQIHTGAEVQGYEPLILISIDVAAIRRQLAK